jgi:regulation of enolase protein 1 (concanavalin A-like superfamily)
LEEAEPDRDAFRALCQTFRAKADEGPFVQWALEPASLPDVQGGPYFLEEFAGALAPGWTWVDPFQDCAYAVQNGLEIQAANGRDLLNVNQSAPRLLCPASGDWAVQVQCAPVSEQAPAIGGLVLWQDDQNYLRLDRGATGHGDLYFGGSLDNQDVLVGRGRLPIDDLETWSGRVWLRLERAGERVSAYCSTDGSQWFTVGSATMPTQGPIQIGVHAIGKIDRAVYRDGYPEGTAIRFEGFQIWQR